MSGTLILTGSPGSGRTSVIEGQVSTVILLQREAGRKTLLVVATTETDEELQAIVDVVADARTLAHEIPLLRGVDVVVRTDGRRAEDVAAEVRELLIAPGL